MKLLVTGAEGQLGRELMLLKGIVPCSRRKLALPAPRPAYPLLARGAIGASGFVAMPHWWDALRRYLSER